MPFWVQSSKCFFTRALLNNYGSSGPLQSWKIGLDGKQLIFGAKKKGGKGGPGLKLGEGGSKLKKMLQNLPIMSKISFFLIGPNFTN